MSSAAFFSGASASCTHRRTFWVRVVVAPSLRYLSTSLSIASLRGYLAVGRCGEMKDRLADTADSLERECVLETRHDFFIFSPADRGGYCLPRVSASPRRESRGDAHPIPGKSHILALPLDNHFFATCANGNLDDAGDRKVQQVRIVEVAPMITGPSANSVYGFVLVLSA